MALEGRGVVLASSAKRPDDGCGNHAPHAAATGAKPEINNNMHICMTDEIHPRLYFSALLPFVGFADGHHLNGKTSPASPASSSGPLAHHRAGDLQLPALRRDSRES